MKKKVLALFLSAALCVTLLPATGMAAEFGSGDAEITENAADSQEVFSAEETTESMGETEQPAEDSEDISEEMVDNSSDATMEDVENAENAENSEDAFGGAEEGVSEEISSEDDPEVLLTELIPEEAGDSMEEENAEAMSSSDPELTVTPTPTYIPSIPDVKDSFVRGLDSPLKFTPNKYYNFTVTGAGTTNSNPGPGDVKWVPVYWSTSPNPTDNRKNTTWRIGSAKGINKAATYNMYIFFQKYVYQKSEWKKTDEVQSAVYQFRSAALTTVKLTTPGLSGTSNSPAGIVFKWKKAANASGYKIYRRTGNSSKWVNIATVSGSNTLVYTDGSVKSGTMYTYTVRAYKGSALSAYNKNGSRIVRLTAPVQYKPSSKASGKLTVRWKKAAGASGYQIQYAASRSMRGSRTVSASALTRTLSGLKKGSTYYVRIRAYKKVSGKTYYSAWSSVKNVKVRK